MAGILIPQDYQMPEDMKGKRKKVRPEDIRSGTLYGQYQLRGSILTIKDASTTASGFMAFGTDMTTIPTSATTGTGIYIDYSGIYGLASDVQQAYMRASDGKFLAGAGVVTLDSSGIAITATTAEASARAYKFLNASLDEIGGMYSVANSLSTNFVYVRSKNVSSFNNKLVLTSSSDSGKDSAIYAIASRNGQSDIGIYVNNTASLGRYVGIDDDLRISGTAPTFRMEDTTASAKSFLMKTDGNKTYMQEVAATDGDLVTLDLANNRVGIGVASPSYRLHVSSGSTQFPRAVVVNASTHATSRRAAFNLGDWEYGQDINGNGTKDFYIYDQVAGATRIYIDTVGNVGFGGVLAFGASAQRVMALKNGVAPTGNVTDTFHLYAADQTAGNSAPHFRTENGSVIKLYTDSATTDLGTVLSNLGLRASGTAYPITTSGAATLTGGVTVNTTGLTITDVDIALGTTTGTKIGTATTQKLGFYNATPIVRPSAYTQTYSTADKTHATPTAATLTDNTGGTANTTLQSISATYSQTEVRNNFADLAAMVNKNTADHLDLAQVVNALIDDLQALGLVG